MVNNLVCSQILVRTLQNHLTPQKTRNLLATENLRPQNRKTVSRDTQTMSHDLTSWLFVAFKVPLVSKVLA